ncbi:MAG TPA: hypothetical protein VEJ18_09995 [Planctomycetota bacterium]|nr:hypothetical protein [Planctomycetota bacterium]
MTEDPGVEKPGMDAALRRERALVVVGAVLFAAAVAAEGILYPEETKTGEATPFTFVGAAVAIVAHGLWILMDLRRRGRPAGRWPGFGFVFGPFAVVVYLVLEYPERKLRLIGLYAGIVLATALVGLGAAHLYHLSATTVP